jgi:hypothetical protein
MQAIHAITVRDLKQARAAGESIAAIVATLRDGDQRESGLYRVAVSFGRRIGGVRGQRFAAWVVEEMFGYDRWENARHEEIHDLAKLLNGILAQKGPGTAATATGRTGVSTVNGITKVAA